MTLQNLKMEAPAVLIGGMFFDVEVDVLEPMVKIK